MGNLEIRLPQQEWPEANKLAVCELIQSHSEYLGFHHMAALKDQMKANNGRGNLWGAYLEGELVGSSACGSRSAYPHLMRHGDIAVRKEFRRRRIGTCLYFAVVCQSIIEGRRTLEDTIIISMSPFMADFLGALGYRHIGTLPKRTSGFRDVWLFAADNTMDHFDRYLDRMIPGTVIEVRETENTRSAFDNQIKVYQAHSQETVATMIALRDRVRQFCTVTPLPATVPNPVLST